MNENLKQSLIKIGTDLFNTAVEHWFTTITPKGTVEETSHTSTTVDTSIKSISTPIIIPANYEPTKRIFKLAPNLYYCRNIVMTCFCNKKDFNGDVYQLGSHSKLGKVYKDKMKGVRGISLPFEINNSLIANIYNPKNGIMFGYGQVDVGPGYTNDSWWVQGTAPKTETGKDYLGNPSAKAGIDAFPQVFEDLGICTFDEAYNGDVQAVVDLIIYQPDVVTGSKVKGNEIPSSDARQWVRELPPTGSDYFSWSELLRGWNLTERPSDVQIRNLLALVKDLLHPLRIAVGELHVGSTLRDPVTNTRVGGRDGSFHLEGRAVDLVPKSMTESELYDYIRNHPEFNSKVRENVLEDVGTSNAHVHLAGPIHAGEPNNTRIKDA